MFSAKPLKSVVAVVALIAVGSAGALAWGQSQEIDSTPAALGPGETRDGNAVALAASHMAALRASRSAADDIAHDVRASRILNDGIADVGASRRVRASGRAVWLAPSADGKSVCLVSPGLAGCPPVRFIVDRGAAPFLAKNANSPYHVGAITTDAVKSVTVVLHDGSQLEVRAVDNVATVDVDERPQSISWVGPHGSESFPLQDDGRTTPEG